MDVTSSTVFDGESTGALTVCDGVTLTITGTHEGAIDVLGGGTIIVEGEVVGPVSVMSLAYATVSGQVSGDVTVLVAGTLLVKEDGRVTGAVTNYGSFTNYGTRSAQLDGRTPDDKPGSDVTTNRSPA